MVHAASKTVSNAIELAMIASSTALMQTCKRGAPSAGVVSLTVCSAEVPCVHKHQGCSAQAIGQQMHVLQSIVFDAVG